jgi:acyl carrier protein
VATREFTFEDLKDILVNRVGLPDAAVVDDPEATFDDMVLESREFVEIQLAMHQE